MDYKEKIKNLLALAESPNEFEAKSALLKARRLMAKYKVSEQALQDVEKEEVIRKNTGITYSLRRDPWVSSLAAVIAKNHCCRSFQTRAKGKQTTEICFVGLSDDLSICVQIFTYAVDCIRSVTKKLRASKGAASADGYGYGFVVGLDDAYSRQQKEENWALVMVVPNAVNKFMDTIPKKPNKSDRKIKDADARAFHKGVQDGHKFKEQKRIGGSNG